ncbi:MAG: fructose-bisphosphate aldolase [Candidatus Odinarchaeota archaeon]|nr:fructose-bisphosphate aldolase [Candidatus Odinarchaeota archaeon]
MTGKEIRLSRIINPIDDRTVTIAMDHGLSDGVLEGIENTKKTINDVSEFSDAVLINAGILRHAFKIIARARLGIIMRIDIAYLPNTKNEDMINLLSSSVERAVKLGAHAVAINGFLGHNFAFESISNLAIIAEACENWGMPLVAEMKFVGKSDLPPWSTKFVKNCARVAYEIGADLIKTYYTGDKESFKEVIDAVEIPIAILGGPRKESLREIFQMVEDALDAGAVGVIFGRNVWHKRDARIMAKALYKIIHDNYTTEEVMKEMFR